MTSRSSDTRSTDSQLGAPQLPGPQPAAVLLAAGRSRRLGTALPKQLLEVAIQPGESALPGLEAGGQEAMVRLVARALLAAGLSPVVAVLGHCAEEVASALQGLPLALINNPHHAQGQSSSVRSGLAALPAHASGALFVPADQPYLGSRLPRALADAHRRHPDSICLPVLRGEDGSVLRRGAPVLFPRRFFAELKQLRGDTGGRVLLQKYAGEIVPVDASPIELQDVDTPEDLEQVRSLLAVST